ncbi:uncharacterized protein LOC135806272 [Sycon ciliatum]|uniref:uncharacterized protein LOC135806272 n=1 Tax=Sycon ciliatum TaxID=27933 RepID=UPI0031F7037C
MELNGQARSRFYQSIDYGVIPSALSPHRLDTLLPPKRTFLQTRVRAAKRHLISPQVFKSFLKGLSVALPVQVLLGVVCIYLCLRYDVMFDCQMSLFVAPVVFPLAFSINACYQRRDKVLDDLSMFKGAAVIIFYCHRDWAIPSGYEQRDFCHRTMKLLTRLIKLIQVYLRIEKGAHRRAVLKDIDHCFSGIAGITEEIRGSDLPASGPLCTRLIHSHNQMCWSFERLRVVREYRTPRTIRAFTKLIIFLLPLLLSPYFTFQADNAKANWVAYYLSVMVTVLYGSLQTLQDNLDDPFDGIGEDDIELDTLDEWTRRSLGVVASPNRTASAADEVDGCPNCSTPFTATPGCTEDDVDRVFDCQGEHADGAVSNNLTVPVQPLLVNTAV